MAVKKLTELGWRFTILGFDFMINPSKEGTEVIINTLSQNFFIATEKHTTTMYTLIELRYLLWCIETNNPLNVRYKYLLTLITREELELFIDVLEGK
jgi:hypothetical protein